ncbi:hydroxyisourate hydrolase [Litchfieldia alkalitelluris]|uniref:hydroxyisourate hydrolase n=1 Tax=Litchfieldia alkalitelluris TaxID=304268 RepID=UPI000995FD6E|nr:hydroxyisourate hydrolase [Litchfieldia alkalitelluris]
MSGLSTHVLDLTHGKPAQNVHLDLYKKDESSNLIYLKSSLTNKDGRLDSPFLSGEELLLGEYEIVFHIGDYFRTKQLEISEPHFLEKVPVRFCITEINGHYHVPLLVSPWGYQVYRGS